MLGLDGQGNFAMSCSNPQKVISVSKVTFLLEQVFSFRKWNNANMVLN